MPDKAVINLSTGLEDSERVTVAHPCRQARSGAGHGARGSTVVLRSGYGSERIAARSESQRCVRPDSVTVMVEAAVGVQLACMRWHSRPAG